MLIGIAFPAGGLNTFSYDADLKRRQAEDSAGLVKFINDMENVLLETDGGGTTQVAYTLEPALYGNLISQRRSGSTSFHHFDALGSTDRLTDPAESVLASYIRTAFGLPQATTGNHPNRYTYVGQAGYRWEPDAGEYDIRRRRYDPARGGWLSPDPLQGELNWYVYVGNCPMFFVDPTGLKCDKWRFWDGNRSPDAPARDDHSETWDTMKRRPWENRVWFLSWFYAALGAFILFYGEGKDMPNFRQIAWHWAGNTGTEYFIDLADYMRATMGDRKACNEQLACAARFAEEHLKPGESRRIIGEYKGRTAVPTTPDWWWTVGGHCGFGRALVKRLVDCSDNDEFEIRFIWRLEDVFTGHMKREEMHQFHLKGLARDFLVTGEFMKTVRWRKGEFSEVCIKPAPGPH